VSKGEVPGDVNLGNTIIIVQSFVGTSFFWTPHKLEQAMSFSLDPFNEGASQNGVFFHSCHNFR
jgi:hypothetical protein